MINRIFKFLLLVICYLLLVTSVFALTKPGPDANIDNLSYVFYLYYDNGQLFADRDYEIKFDILNEAFTPESPDEQSAYTGQIFNLKPQSEIAKIFKFDPKKGNPNFTSGKIVVNGPYIPDALRVQFMDNQGNQLVSIFLNAGSICNDDGSCNAGAGENEKTCPNDCKKPRGTPVPVTTENPSALGLGFDLNSILIYVVGGIVLLMILWFGWKWWKKRKEENFLPPPPPAGGPTPPSALFPPTSPAN